MECQTTETEDVGKWRETMNHAEGFVYLCQFWVGLGHLEVLRPPNFRSNPTVFLNLMPLLHNLQRKKWASVLIEPSLIMRSLMVMAKVSSKQTKAHNKLGIAINIKANASEVNDKPWQSEAEKPTSWKLLWRATLPELRSVSALFSWHSTKDEW